MKISITTQELFEYLSRQCGIMFPDKYKFEGKDVEIAFHDSLERLEDCLLHINFRHYSKDGQAYFQHMYSDQYSQFLCMLSNTLWKQSQNKPICDKLVNLNKALNGILCPYTVELPRIYIFLHPIGTIVGNAEYSDYLVLTQNVTINYANGDNGEIPLRIGKGVFFAAGSKIIGNKPIGKMCSIGTNTVIHNREVPSDSIAYNDENGKLIIKQRKKECRAQLYFNKIG